MLSSPHTIFIKATVLLGNGAREGRGRGGAETQKDKSSPRSLLPKLTALPGTLSDALSLYFAGG